MSLALYRFYNDGGQLLYVGITNNPPQRMSQHAANKAWWPQVRGITVDWYPDRASVLAAEKRAINVENPLHNVQHKPDVKVQHDHIDVDEEDIVWTPTEVACQVMSDLQPQEIDTYLAKAREDFDTSGDDEATHVYAALSASHDLWHDRLVLQDCLHRLLQTRPDYRKLLFRARSDVIEHMGSSHTETDILARAAVLAAFADTTKSTS